MIRHLLKRKVYTLINILGLATGLSVCLIAVLFIRQESGFDTFHEKGDRIYRLAMDRIYPGRTAHFAATPGLIAQALQREFPEVQEATRLMNIGGGGVQVKVGGQTFEERKVIAADSNFFRVFTGSFIEGDGATAMQKPNTLVINERTAKKYFGSARAAMGKTVELFDGSRQVVISGVCKDWPVKSHLVFDLVIPMSSFPGMTGQATYYDITFYTYLLLRPETSFAALEAKFPVIIEKYVAGSIEKGFGQTFRQFLAAGNGYRYYLQPLQGIHLDSDLEGEITPNGSRKALSLFATIAGFILFLACINFINLTTANSVERAREVGIRKTFGSGKGALIRQFLGESVLLSMAGLAVAMILISFLLPVFNRVTGSTLVADVISQPRWVFSLIVFAILVGIIAGVYPAFVLSAFQPIMVLKGRFKNNRYGTILRNGLVVFQFAISVILIICTMVVYRQMRYVLGDGLGFKKDHIITIAGAYQLRDKRKVFYNELSRLPGVELVSKCSDVPGGDAAANTAFQVMGSGISRTERTIWVDGGYADMFGLQLKEGRFFHADDAAADSLSLILNEKAVQDLGLKTPIGARITSKEVYLNGSDGTPAPYVYTVVGVVRDYHFQSMHMPITPLVIMSNARIGSGTTVLRVKAAGIRTVIPALEKTWKQLDARHDLVYSFLDDVLAEQYKSELRMQQGFTIFSCLAIFIGCIGLLGLATHATLQRTREISIRKVLGAGAGSIVAILSKDFLRLVIIATLLAFPLAWWIMHKWLQNFAYRQNISWWIFLLAAAVAVFIAFATISFRAIKAALVNPIKVLRSE